MTPSRLRLVIGDDHHLLAEALRAALAKKHEVCAVAYTAATILTTVTTHRPDGSPHVVPVGFGYDQESGLARIITFAPSKKARNLRAAPGSRAVVCQVDGGRWLALEGPAEVTDDPSRVASASPKVSASTGKIVRT